MPGQELRVPLYAEQAADPVRLHGLDDAVLSPGHRPEPCPEPADRLVVEGVDSDLGTAGHGLEEAAGGDGDVVDGVVGPVLDVVVPPGDGRDMLDERSAEGHVENLGAAADPEHGEPGGDRRHDEGDLGGVAPRVDAVSLRHGRLPVAGRIDVAPAGEKETVEGEERGFGVIGSERRQDERQAAGAHDRIDVDLVDLLHRTVAVDRRGGGRDPDARLHTSLTVRPPCCRQVSGLGRNCSSIRR